MGLSHLATASTQAAKNIVKSSLYFFLPVMLGYNATRSRIVACIRAVTWSTWNLPAGPYVGVLATLWVVGAKPMDHAGV